MYQSIFYIHVGISIIALLLGFWIILLAIRGIIKKSGYKNINRIVGRTYVISLYFQMAMGLIMYFYPGQSSMTESSAIDPGNSPYVRFWEIEHIAIMVFAVFIVQIGCIFIGKTKSSIRKYHLSLFYFGIPLALMIFSMIMAMR